MNMSELPRQSREEGRISARRKAKIRNENSHLIDSEMILFLRRARAFQNFLTRQQRLNAKTLLLLASDVNSDKQSLQFLRNAFSLTAALERERGGVLAALPIEASLSDPILSKR